MTDPRFIAGVAAGLKAAAGVAARFSTKPDRNLHPDVPWDQMDERAITIAHMTAQSIAADVAAIDPATIKEDGNHE